VGQNDFFLSTSFFFVKLLNSPGGNPDCIRESCRGVDLIQQISDVGFHHILRKNACCLFYCRALIFQQEADQATGLPSFKKKVNTQAEQQTAA
jgi:hypothetical protein